LDELSRLKGTWKGGTPASTKEPFLKSCDHRREYRSEKKEEESGERKEIKKELEMPESKETKLNWRVVVLRILHDSPAQAESLLSPEMPHMLYGRVVTLNSCSRTAPLGVSSRPVDTTPTSA
jgi:hypothetical protein